MSALRDTGGALPTSFAIVPGEAGVTNIGFPLGDPRRYGVTADGVTDDWQKLTRCLAAAPHTMTGDPSKTYAVSQPLVVPAGKEAVNVNLNATVGYATNYTVELKNGARFAYGVLDGTNVPAPTGPWIGVGYPGGSLIIADGTTVAADDVILEYVTLRNTAGGTLFFKNCKRIIIRHCLALNTQSYAANETNACFELFGCDDAALEFNEVNGYFWKAYNMGAASRDKAFKCHAYGGTQQTGHSSHYLSTDNDCAYVDCNHEGIGFGHKSFKCNRSRIERFVTNGGNTLAYFQGSTDFVLSESAHVAAPATGGQSVIVESIAGFPVNAGLIVGCTLRRTVIGTTINHIGVMIISTATDGVNNLTIRDVVSENQLFTVWAQRIAAAIIDNLVIENLNSISSAQYPILLYVKSARVNACVINNPADNSAGILVYTQNGLPGTLLEITNNRFPDMGAGAGEAIQVGLDATNVFECKFDTVNVSGNKSNRGNLQLHIDLSNTAGGAGTNYIKTLVTNENVGHAVGAANAWNITFATVIQTTWTCIGNTLNDGAGNLRNVTVTNGAQVISGLESANNINGWTNPPVALLPAIPFGGRVNTTAYGANIAIDASLGGTFVIAPNNGVAFNFNNPTNPRSGQIIRIRVRNISGGALGAITWGAAFKQAVALNPATGFNRTVDFQYDGTNWFQETATMADVPN